MVHFVDINLCRNPKKIHRTMAIGIAESCSIRNSKCLNGRLSLPFLHSTQKRVSKLFSLRRLAFELRSDSGSKSTV